MMTRVCVLIGCLLFSFSINAQKLNQSINVSYLPSKVELEDFLKNFEYSTNKGLYSNMISLNYSRTVLKPWLNFNAGLNLLDRAIRVDFFSPTQSFTSSERVYYAGIESSVGAGLKNFGLQTGFSLQTPFYRRFLYEDSLVATDVGHLPKINLVFFSMLNYNIKLSEKITLTISGRADIPFKMFLWTFGGGIGLKYHFGKEVISNKNMKV